MSILKKLYNSYLIELLIAVGYLLGIYWAFWHVPLWWDEGWNALAARNWLEVGSPICPTVLKSDEECLSGSFPLTFLISQSFRFFGVGVWQLRLPSTIVSIVCLVIFYFLIKYLWSRGVARFSFIFLPILSFHKAINPIFVAPQVLYENSMYIFLFITSYLFASKKVFSFLSLFQIGLLGGCGMLIKAQYLLFFPVALVGMALVMLVQKQKNIYLMFIPLLTSFFVYFFLSHIESMIRPISKLSDSLGRHWSYFILNIDLTARYQAFDLVSLFALPVIISLVYYMYCYLWTKSRRIYLLENDTKNYAKLFLLVFSFSWALWFLFSSAPLSRYLSPVIIVGMPFLANFLLEIYKYSKTNFTFEKLFVFNNCKVLSLNLVLFIIIFQQFFFNLTYIRPHLSSFSEYQFKDLVSFLNSQLPENALIESNEIEVFFLVNKRMHFPEFNQDRIGLVDSLLKLKSFGPVYIVKGTKLNYEFLYEQNLTEVVASFGHYIVYKYKN